MRRAEHLSACELIATVLDPGSFVSWDATLPTRRWPREYAVELSAARSRAGTDESIITGEGRVRGHRVAIAVSEFEFLGGSLGVDASARLVATIRRATREGLPLLAAPASGGTRMQEGATAFVQMIPISAALAEHLRAKLPYLVYLRHPTTGGALASWGSLGQVTVAEPGALVGFLGPRVYRAIHGADFPEGVQQAENLFDKGLIDAVLDPRHLSALAARVLDIWGARDAEKDVFGAEISPEGVRARSARNAPADGWVAVQRSRSAQRPGLRSLLQNASFPPVVLNGTGRGESDPALTLAMTGFGGQGAVVLGQDRRRQGPGSAMGPAALRVAARGIRLAEELGLPLVTVIDTPGAALAPEAEEGGLAGEIARCLRALLEADVPTVSLILGQGAGGGALALLPADRVLIAENGWLSPLPPEGAAAIRYRDPALASRSAREQRIGAAHLLADGVVDEIVKETPEPAERIACALGRALDDARAFSSEDRLQRRGARFAGLVPNGDALRPLKMPRGTRATVLPPSLD